MGKDLAERFPAARDTFAAIDEALGVSLSRIMWEGPEDQLTLTHNAQPAILAHSAAAFAVVKDQLGAIGAGAGHSLGEYSAWIMAGSLSPASGARLVRRRGELMLEAGRKRPGAMAAILGLATAEVEAACGEASSSDGVVVAANLNAPDQTVISGDPPAVERGGVACKTRGAKRVIPLKVSGAFHSPLMAPAVDGLREALGQVDMTEGAFPIIANASAEPIRTGTDAKRLLADQLTAPVRWVGCMQQAATLCPVARFVEIGPGGVLSGLLKKIVPGASAITLGTAAEVEKFLESGITA
jgi:[acyl-carrier-protein] S-malonyltransferase